MTKPRPEALATAAGARAAAQGKLYRGFMEELVRDAGPGPLTVWMLAWRCKRCGHCWPVRRHRQTHDGQVTTPGAYIVPRVASKIDPARIPKSCPGCDCKLWWKDYQVPLNGPMRRGLRRRPVMLKQYREELGRAEAGEETPGEGEGGA